MVHRFDSYMSKNKGMPCHGPFNIEIFAAGVCGLSHGKYSWITCNRLKIIIQVAVFLEEVSALEFTMSSMCYKGYKYTIVTVHCKYIVTSCPSIKTKIINDKHICLHSYDLICWKFKLSHTHLLQVQNCNYIYKSEKNDLAF